MHRVPVEQADVGLLDEIRRLPPDGQALAREHPASHLPKLALDQRSELVQGLRVTATPRLKQPGHIGDHCSGVYPLTAGWRRPLSRHRKEGQSRIAHPAAEFRLYKRALEPGRSVPSRRST